jgi:SNF2 family DNA or RNA helicase
MKLIDNVNHRFGDDLRETVGKGSRLSIAASTFSIYAFESLRKELARIEELRFIFTSPAFIEEDIQQKARQFYIPHIVQESELCGGQFEVRLRNELNQRAIARECAAWVSQKARFKSNRTPNNPLGGMVQVDGPQDNGATYTNVHGFTTADLGYTPRAGFPTLIQRTDYPDGRAYLDWFNQVWNNDKDLIDVTDRIQEYLNTVVKENSPEFIYFITLYNIFKEFLEDVSLDSLPNDKVGFRETQIWNRLYNFQRDAVIGAINKLERYKGCILADSVGLGKTFSALGIIKYYELRNKDVLVLCPKKLEANWNTYRHNDKDNILAADRFSYDVLFHTDLTRERGDSNGRKLEKVNWGNYGLVVIDESHNFRNNNTSVGRENRYQKLLRKVIREGVETKVLMLSATPVNNRFNDLRNQLALAYAGEAANIDDKLDTDQGIELIFRRAQQAFNAWMKFGNEERTTKKLLDMLDIDFFTILDSLTIARSRKHITTYYDTTEIGRFPKRNAPVNLSIPLSDSEKSGYDRIAEKLTVLNLSVYSPLGYILPSKVSYYAEKYDKTVNTGRLTQVDREKSLQILMRINLLKRLESSVDSFCITLTGILAQIGSASDTIDKGKETYTSFQADLEDEDFDWEPDWGDEESIFGGKIKVHLAHMDTLRWKEDLQRDETILQELLTDVKALRNAKDRKLEKLKDIIAQKVQHPINSDNKKIIVFTAFADTAEYLYDSISEFAFKEYGLKTALITGTTRKCSSKRIPNDLNVLLSSFSPVSKNRDLMYSDINEDIEILIATDCISEGQNLQDCDFLVNYDIHWNPVRIIQRFGRIDRIGSKNDSITMVNFWPDVTLDRYIKLKQKVESKMLIANMAGTGDDNLLNSNEKDLEYRKVQLQKLKSEVIDLEDLREGISITDLGLNDFRVDLANLMKKYGEMKHVPNGLHAVVASNSEIGPGVIFVLRNINQELNSNKSNRLHPYYLIYLSSGGDISLGHSESKRILDALRLLSRGNSDPILSLCTIVAKETDEYRNMNEYSDLLRKSIGSILQTEERKEVMSLFQVGGTTALTKRFQGLEDFSLVSFVIIK